MFRIAPARGYRGRWVRTERLQSQPSGGPPALRYYRNPFTDDPGTCAIGRAPARRTVANTAPLIHARAAWQRKEDGLPTSWIQYARDARTVGAAAQAQPDIHGAPEDPLTGEMISFGYDATGLASRRTVHRHAQLPRARLPTASR